jgi:hypothetical protein
MEAVTAFFSLIGAILASRYTLGKAFGLLLFSALVWPEFLRFPVGIIQMSIPRTIAIVILTRALLYRRDSFRLTAPDGYVLGLWFWTVLSQIFSGASFQSVSSSVGYGLDTTLIYFAARLSLRSLEDLKDTISFVALISLIAGLLGVVEATKGWSPWDQLDQFKKFVWIEKDTQFRLGLKRASGSASVYIHFGVAMCILCVMQVALLNVAKERRLTIFSGIIGSTLGVLSSLSSGPWLMFFIFLFLFFFYKFKSLIRPSIWLAIFSIIAIEILSNRHFYHLIDYFTLDKATAWYRAKLIEVAFDHLNEWWLIGTGDNSLIHWAAALDGRSHLDIVNQYIWAGVNGGLPAMLLFIFIQLTSLKNAAMLFRGNNTLTSHLGFSVAAATIALMFCMNTVSLFGPALIYSFALYGMLPHFSKPGKAGDASISVYSSRHNAPQ